MGDCEADGLQVQLLRNLRELVELVRGTETKRLWIASAYVNEGGVDALLPLIERATQTRAVLGAGKNTDPAALSKLKDLGVTVRLRRQDRAEFHPKCYFGVEARETAWAAIGSANLTHAAVQANVELMTFVRGAARHPFFRHLQDWIDQQYRLGVMPTPGLLKAVHSVYEANRSGSVDPKLERQRGSQTSLSGGIPAADDTGVD